MVVSSVVVVVVGWVVVTAAESVVNALGVVVVGSESLQIEKIRKEMFWLQNLDSRNSLCTPSSQMPEKAAPSG